MHRTSDGSDGLRMAKKQVQQDTLTDWKQFRLLWFRKEQKIHSSRELHQQQKKLSFKNSRFYFLTIHEKPKGLAFARPFPIIFIEKHGKSLKNNEESVNMKLITISKKQII